MLGVRKFTVFIVALVYYLTMTPPLRGEDFVTKKIVSDIVKIKLKKKMLNPWKYICKKGLGLFLKIM